MPTTQCTALAAALKNKGMTHAQVAKSVGATEKRITDIFNGTATPTQAEFNKIAQALGITSPVPHTSVHSTK